MLARLLMIAAVAGSVFWLVQRSSERLDRSTEPAGFTRGLVHGALMPMALPNLLFGRDVTIYAPSNTGRFYKLGYTAGVNVCGLIFFSLSMWRIRRLRNEWRGRVV